MIAGDRLGHLDQVALASDRPVVDLRVLGGVELRVHPARRLDIGAAWFRGVPLAWIGAAGEGGSYAVDWRAAWDGGLVTTCDLDNVGAPSEGIGLHGTYTFLAAREVTTERSRAQAVVRATIDDPRGLRVKRTIRTLVESGRVEIVDRTANLADDPLEAPLPYHVNLGWPLWDEGAHVETDAAEVAPRDDDAAPHDWSTAAAQSAALPERVGEHVGATHAVVVNERLALRVTVESDLPR
ncbi:MAG TPA: DUF4432 family protein, partial [Gaiellaceae bacterium]|nr:DUF4432 family protein [Gaiellaceae bacterium]